MQSIEERLLALESENGVAGSSAEVEQALQAYQSQMLVKLKAIRARFSEEGGDVTTIRKERDDAITQNALLRKEIEKQNYRIQHLIKALNAAEAKSK